MGQILPTVIDEVLKVTSNVVIVDDPEVSENVDAVYTDFSKATQKHLDRLYNMGHRNIAFIGGRRNRLDVKGTPYISDDDCRQIAYEEWMRKKHLDKYIKVYLGGWRTSDGMQAMSLLLEEHKNNMPTAIVVGNDPIAVGVYRAIQKSGLVIPDDISIVSFDNIEVAEFLTPSLSTVNVNTEDIGKISLRVLNERINGVRTVPVRVEVANELIIRESETNIEKSKR